MSRSPSGWATAPITVIASVAAHTPISARRRWWAGHRSRGCVTGLRSSHVTALLWHIELSHYNEKARWALDYKGVPYELRAPMPGFHGARALYETRGKQRRLPVLELDGRTIGDSTAIIAALEEHTPQPALYPVDPADRARALELEDYFDEELGPEVRRFGWHHLLADPDAAAEALFRGTSPLRAKVLRTTFGGREAVGQGGLRHRCRQR